MRDQSENQLYTGDDNEEIVLITQKGKILRMTSQSEAVIMNVESQGTVLTVTEKGYGKRTKLGEYRTQSRGGSGMVNIRTSEKNWSGYRCYSRQR